MSQLILSGTHAAAAWLAPYLARRGVPVAWAEPVTADQDPCWGVSRLPFGPLGEPAPVWPLEFCAQQLDGLARYQDGRLIGLQAWPTALLAPADLRRELEAEFTRLQLPRLPAPGLAAGLPPETAWSLAIDYAPCRAGCPGRVCTGLLQGPSLPAGLLELHCQAGTELAIAALGPGRACFSGEQIGPPDDAQLWSLLAQVLGRQRLGSVPLRWRPACRCLPRLLRDGNRLRLLLPPESLLPGNAVLQGAAWLIAVAVGRWLSEEFQALDRLGSDLEAYLAKVHALLGSLSKTHKFLQFLP